jgi:hypothetical protein
MAYKTVTVDVDISLSDIDDDVLIEHLESGGYKVTYGATYLDAIIHYMNRGNLYLALIEIERVYPELKGLVDLYEKEKGA